MILDVCGADLSPSRKRLREIRFSEYNVTIEREKKTISNAGYWVKHKRITYKNSIPKWIEKEQVRQHTRKLLTVGKSV